MRRQSRTFVIADTHFQHEMVARARGFDNANDHDQFLIRQWNLTVQPQDIVWHLGDVFFGSSGTAEAVINLLNGHKKLVMGNHDYKDFEVYRRCFEKIYGIIEYRDAILSHAPVHTEQMKPAGRWNLNIHGHLHAQQVTRPPLFSDVDEGSFADPRYVCVSVEHLRNAAPVEIKELISARYNRISQEAVGA